MTITPPKKTMIVAVQAHKECALQRVGVVDKANKTNNCAIKKGCEVLQVA